MDVIVPDDQLSLAIGRKGQNVRLAVQLTGWKIDIKSESKMRELAQWLAEAVSVVEGCGEADAELLLQQGITSLEDLAELQTSEMLTSASGHRRGRGFARSRCARASWRSRSDGRRRGSGGACSRRKRRPRLPQPPPRAAAATAEGEGEAEATDEAQAGQDAEQGVPGRSAEERNTGS